MKFARLGALAAPAAAVAVAPYSPQDKATIIARKYTGFNLPTGEFNWRWLLEGWGPFAATTLFTKGLSKLSGMINRM